MSARSQGSTGRRRTAARLAAVQALYEMDVADASADTVIGAMLKDRWLKSVSDPDIAEVDEAHFTEILRAVATRSEALDLALNASLAERMRIERLEVLLRAILRAGAYELSARMDIPASVIINEYLDVAHAFYSGKEPGLVNAVLDRTARQMGRDEVAGEPVDPGGYEREP